MIVTAKWSIILPRQKWSVIVPRQMGQPNRASSKERTEVIRSVDKMTSWAMGTAPPDRLLLPPCGTTASPRELQCLRICATAHTTIVHQDAEAALWHHRKALRAAVPQDLRHSTNSTHS